MKEVSLWQLADDVSVYRDQSGYFILTSPDGDDEMSEEVFATEEEAEAFALAKGWKIVPLLP